VPQNFVRGGDPGQGYLLPPDVRDWLPAGHLAWELLGLAGEMDLAPFTSWYRADGQGRAAYHPGMMVPLVCYCFCKGIRSSRAIEAATFDDVGARVICGNLHPDHSTIHRFITRHEQPVKGLLAASVVACAKQGLVKVDVVAGDGTKVKANASAAANATLDGLGLQIAELEALVAAEVDAWVEQARAEDAADGVDGGDDPPGGDGPASGQGGGPQRSGRARAAAAGTLARRRAARDRLATAEQARQAEAAAARAAKITRLEDRAARAAASAAAQAAAADARAAAWAAKAAAKAAAGSRKRPDGRVPAGADTSAHVTRARRAAATAQTALAEALTAPAAAGKPGKINTTDPSSKMMQAKNGGFGQLHNIQALASKDQVILGIGTHPSPADVAGLHPLLDKARATLDAAGIRTKIAKALFDAGYASDTNFTTPCQPELYVAVTKEARQTGRLTDGKHPKTTKQSWQQMAAKLATPDGKALYRQRAGIIEPVFAQLFARLGTRLHYRDQRTDLELHLWAATHNILKAIRARQRRTTQQTPTPAPAT
jgi:transposase